MSNAQSQSVSGKITASGNNENLVGVTVLEFGTTNGTITDNQGNYSIMVSSPNAKLQFSYMGYLTEVVDLAGRSVVNFQLVEDIQQLTEVIVIGYGVQRKSDLTGVVSSVSAEDMRKMSVPTVEQALQGRAAGVYVTRTDGEPGSGAKIFVRGPGSIGNTDPLWIVDGVPSLSGNHLDPSSIASIEILKDASAAAIYGARAANGVILVTTKRGATGKPKVNFNSYYGLSQPLGLPSLALGKEYASLRVAAYESQNFYPSDRAMYERIASGDTIIPHNVDWLDVKFRNAIVQNYDLNVSGGSETSSYYVGLGYLSEEGTHIGSNFDRFSFTVNTDSKVNKWFSMGQSLMLTQTRKDPKKIDNNKTLRVNPFMPVYDEVVSHPYTPYGTLDKDLFGFEEPNHYGIENVHQKEDKFYRATGNIYANISPVKGLNWRTTVGGVFEVQNEREYVERYDLGTYTNPRDMLTIKKMDKRDLTANSVLSYGFKYDRHDVQVMVGLEAQRVGGTEETMVGQDFNQGKIVFNQSNPDYYKLSGKEVDPERWYSQFGRVNYSYDDRYLVTMNIRRDGSSKFPELNKFGVFPSFSAAWKISNESFMQGYKQLFDLKVRAGYGKLGNAKIDNFMYLSRMTTDLKFYTFSDKLVVGAVPTNYANDDIRWETITTYNIGIDLRMLQNRLAITSDLYQKNTDDMLIKVDLPYSAGFGREATTQINAGQVRNQGFEIAVEYRDKKGDFEYSVSGNLGFNKHKILKLNEDDIITKGTLGQFVTKVGSEMSMYEGFQVERLFQATQADSLFIINSLIASGLISNASGYDPKIHPAPGDFKYADINPDGKIDDKDRVFLGSPWPKLVYGINLAGSYKGVDLTMFLQGVYGNKIYNLNKRYTENVWSDYSPTTRALDAWSVSNTGSSQPRITYSDPANNLSRSSSYFVESGSYLRLKNLQIGYTIPRVVSERVGVERFRVYLSGSNLLTITSYTGIDPEISKGDNTERNLDEFSYPQSRIYQVGVQLSF